MHKYPRVWAALLNQPWAILPERLDELVAIVQRAERGGLSAEQLQALVGDGEDRPVPERRGPVAILPLHGVLSQRMNLFSQISGGTSTEVFGQDLDALLADPQVQAIVVDIDSPGGATAGVEELAQRVYQARARKPIVAVADSLAGSAAYWVGSQASQMVASPSSEVGSIGVVFVHKDVSQAEAQMGIKTSVIRIPAAKALGHPSEPLTDDVRAEFEARFAPFYSMFVDAVARGRGVSAQEVRDGFGQGRVLAAKAALKAGMVDRVETLAQTVQRLSTPQGRRAVIEGHQGGAHAVDEAHTAQEPTATAQDAHGDLRRAIDLLDVDV